MLSNPSTISTVALIDTLRAFDVSLDQWSEGVAKSVPDLVQEIKERESILRIDQRGISRVLGIVKMMIEDPTRGILHEEYQVRRDRTRKDRNQPPGGKIKALETPEEALLREMMEELELGSADFEFELVQIVTEERPSKSFPGLRCIYEVHRFRITLTPHITIEDGHSVTDPETGTTSFFRWQPN